MNMQQDSFGRYVLLALRLYLGWSWLAAGLEKVLSPAYHGQAPAVAGFLQGALKAAPFAWYKALAVSVFLPNSGLFAFLVSWGEVLVGLGLLFGVLTNLACLFAILMNASFLLAGTVSTNATYIMMELAIIFGAAGLTAGFDGRLARSGFTALLLVPDPDRTASPFLTWGIVTVLLILAALAYGPAGSLHLPEFSNPAGQASRTLVFAAILYGMKAVRNGKRVERATPLEPRRAA